MRVLLVIFLLILFNSKTLAQHAFGISTGLNISNARPEYPMYKSQTSRLGLVLNGTYNYSFSNGIYLGSGLSYSQMGYKKEYAGESTYSENSRYDYLSIPFKAGYSIGTKWQIMVGILLEPALLLSGNVVGWFPNTGDKVYEGNLYIATKSFDFRVGGEFGLDYTLTDSILIGLNVRYIAGLIPFTTWDHTDNVIRSRPLEHNAVAISLGVQYRLIE